MTPSTTRRSTALMAGVAVLLTSLACYALGVGTPAPGEPQQQPDNATFKSNVVFGSGAFVYPDPAAGLAGLSGYKAVLTLAFDGTRAGQPDKWTKTYEMLATRDPAARLLTIHKTGSLPDLTALMVAESEGVSYQRRAEGACSANPVNADDPLMARLEPAAMLSAVVGADEAGSETVNGVAASHYTFDERALGQSGLITAGGALWVANEGGYIVRYLLTTQGSGNYFGEGIEGTLTWDYELTGADQPVAVALPADCPAGMLAVPRLQDASNVSDMPGLLQYDTATSMADAAAFYEKELPALGWQQQGEPAVKETLIFVDFLKGDQKMTLMVGSAKDVTTVRIVTVR